MVSNDGQQDPRGALGFGPTLLPVPHRRGCETKSRGKLRLAQAERLTKGSNVDYGHAVNFHHGLLYTSDEPAAVVFTFLASGIVGISSFSSTVKPGSEAGVSKLAYQAP
jgi:hypothetical protein